MDLMLIWWMRIVGLFYLLKFLAVALVKAPIRAQTPDAILRAASGDPVARFLEDTWVIFGFEMAALGVALLVCSRAPRRAIALVHAILGVELSGMLADLYQLARGHDPQVPGTWFGIHALIIVLGVIGLRRGRE